MSSRLVFALQDALGRADVRGADLIIFILQLLAWRKSTTSHAGLALPTIKQTSDSPDVGRALLKAFEDLVAAMGPNAAAFELDIGLLRDLSSSSLGNALKILSDIDEDHVNYPEAIDYCAELGGLSETYGAIPDELADLALRIAKIRDNDTVYCPFNCSYKLAAWANRYTRNVFIEPTTQSPLPFLLNILLDGSSKVRFSDPIANPAWYEGGQLQKFDVTLANPPFGSRYSQTGIVDLYRRFPEQAFYGEVLQLRHILAQTKRRAIVFVANGVLFRSTAGERAFKQDIVKNGILRAVISLPPGLLSTAMVPISMIVLDKDHANSAITFIDASSEDFVERIKGRVSRSTARHTLTNIDKIVDLFERPRQSSNSYVASIGECADNEFNLLAGRYVLSGDSLRLDDLLKNRKTVQLGDIATVIRAQGLPKDGDGEGIEVGEVGSIDIAEDGSISDVQKTVIVSDGNFQRLQKQKLLLKDGDIIVAIKGSVGKVGIVTGQLPKPMVPGQSYALIRPNPSGHLIHSVVLYHYLASRVGQALIQSRASGVTVKMIQSRDLHALPVIIPSAEEEAEILKIRTDIQSLLKKIEAHKQEIEALRNKHWSI